MKFVTKLLSFVFLLLVFTSHNVNSNSYENILRDAAKKNGFKNFDTLYVDKNKELIDVGKVFFNSKNLSLNGNIACQSCHLNEFSSADGLPNAVGVHGEGKGKERLKSEYLDIIPRNTLPFWGRGGVGFNTFFGMVRWTFLIIKK